jgi:histidine triad (HIT) family protein
MQFNGTAAGQTVFHFHMHIVPCYERQTLATHARGMAPAELLEKNAERLRNALNTI